MNAYAMLDRVQDLKDDAEQQEAEKDAWIEAETARILALFPDQLMNFRSINLPDEVREATHAPAAADMYADFAWQIANNQAQSNYQLNQLGWRA